MGDRYTIVNSPETRAIIEESDNVRAVIQGHCHRGGTAIVNGIPYITMTGSVLGKSPEFNRFSIVSVESGKITVEGFGGQETYEFTW